MSVFHFCILVLQTVLLYMILWMCLQRSIISHMFQTYLVNNVWHTIPRHLPCMWPSVSSVAQAMTRDGSSGEVGDLIDKMPEKFQKFCQGIRSPACWLHFSVLGAVACIIGTFLLMQPPGKYVHVLERKLWRQGDHNQIGESQREEFPCTPRIVGPVWVAFEKFFAQLWILDVTGYPLPHSETYLEGMRTV